eukprot:CAMPEP_0197414708 /NCGR_PEP_ID=MMETSP1170-20131217/1396_1 /TAXON_ID=54406 /ORGANISM="Sarcinochrysis sp, Strain CCMP770" /LENGTH=45 /DNA_ID= /DNA_START= /DNA_END= /DNA_ORIENTATION=
MSDGLAAKEKMKSEDHGRSWNVFLGLMERESNVGCDGVTKNKKIK